jgi:DNA ligase (NAD+)
VEELAAVYGLGEITARTIAEGLTETLEEMEAVLAAGIITIAPPPREEEQPLRGFSFCFTGEMASMKRNEAEERIKALGGTSKASVVKDLSFLVTNDPESGSGKNKKARTLEIPIITEEEFLGILEDPSRARAKGKGKAGTGKSRSGQGELF